MLEAKVRECLTPPENSSNGGDVLESVGGQSVGAVSSETFAAQKEKYAYFFLFPRILYLVSCISILIFIPLALEGMGMRVLTLTLILTS